MADAVSPRGGAASGRAPFPKSLEQFGSDPRISYDKETETYTLEDENGEEWEWYDKVKQWMPMLDEALVAQHMSSYKKDGEDEETQVPELIRKRKAEIKAAETEAKKQKKQRPNSAIYVTGIPVDASFDEIEAAFSKHGLIEEDIHTNLPKIRMYANDEGSFNGTARIIYFKPESTHIAIQLMDGTDFRNFIADGPMRVEMASANYGVKKVVSVEAVQQQRSKGDRKKAMKKMEEMKKKLEWTGDDEFRSDSETISGPPKSTKYSKMVVIKNAFRVIELEEDASAMLDIKEDMRDMFQQYGNVTNVILYDLEPAGVVTVRFDDPVGAARCAEATNGRMFDGRQLTAYVPESNERYRKSTKGDVVSLVVKSEKDENAFSSGDEEEENEDDVLVANEATG